MSAAVAVPAGPGAPAGQGGGAGGNPTFWQRHRLWLVVGVAVVVAVLVALWAQGGAEYSDPLDPQNPGPDGAQALAQVLGDEGVDVTIVRSAAELRRADIDPRTTVVVTGSEKLASSTAAELVDEAGDARLVVVDPPYFLLGELDSLLTTVYAESEEVEADCTGEGGGRTDYDGLSVTVDAATGFDARTGCFRSGDAYLLAYDRGIDFFGAGEALTNDQILRDDNAAVALRMLGQDERLVWYVPSYDDAGADEVVSIWSFAPTWLRPALWLTVLAVLALVVWRFRRLGPLSREPLPVVVRAAETARSRGRLYRRGNDRPHAAGALRAAARRRLAARLRLGRGAEPAAVVDSVAHLLARPRDEIDALLGAHAPEPSTDAELVQLAQTLARLMREVRRG